MSDLNKIPLAISAGSVETDTAYIVSSLIRCFEWHDDTAVAHGQHTFSEKCGVTDMELYRVAYMLGNAIANSMPLREARVWHWGRTQDNLPFPYQYLSYHPQREAPPASHVSLTAYLFDTLTSENWTCLANDFSAARVYCDIDRLVYTWLKDTVALEELGDSLRQIEDRWGTEHGFYTQKKWRDEINESLTLTGYWEWVIYQMQAGVSNIGYSKRVRGPV